MGGFGGGEEEEGAANRKTDRKSSREGTAARQTGNGARKEPHRKADEGRQAEGRVQLRLTSKIATRKQHLLSKAHREAQSPRQAHRETCRQAESRETGS